MQKPELREVVQVVTNLAFNYVHREELKIQNWKKSELKKEIREAVQDAAEDFGIVECKCFVSCVPDKDQVVLQVHGADNDAKTDRLMMRYVPWEEFTGSLIDSDVDHLEWWQKKLRKLLREINEKCGEDESD